MDYLLLNVIVESDSQVLLVTTLHDPFQYKNNSSVGLLFKDCKLLVNSIQGCSIIVHVLRSANQVTHCLARASVSCNRFWIYTNMNFPLSKKKKNQLYYFKLFIVHLPFKILNGLRRAAPSSFYILYFIYF